MAEPEDRRLSHDLPEVRVVQCAASRGRSAAVGKVMDEVFYLWEAMGCRGTGPKAAR